MFYLPNPGGTAGTGLYLTQYRAYDPSTGKWISRDPIAEEGGVNLYTYVSNNPLRYTDRLGLSGNSSPTTYSFPSSPLTLPLPNTNDPRWIGSPANKAFVDSVYNACPNNGDAKKHGGDAHNDAIDELIDKLKQNPDVENIRKNQQQVDVNGNKVGTNRPDVQYDKNGDHYVVEYDNVPKNSADHGNVIQANDPKAIVDLNLLK